jgi:competence protein ComEC
MTVGRETAGFALPFAAGVLLAAYSEYIAGISPAAVMTVLAAAVICLMHPSGTGFPTWVQAALTFTAVFASGALCGITSSLIAPGLTPSGISLWAEGLGGSMGAAIDSIPFSDRDYNAVAKALITGERSDIPDDLAEAFRGSGASHILALSGLHLGIIYSIITRSLSIFGNRRPLLVPRSVTTILTCGIYTLATGAGPSITRAFLFILIAEAARISERHRSTAQTFWSALIIQLTITPLSIRSAGFQLSYAAMAAIAFVLPWLQSFWPGSIHDDRGITKLTRKIWNAAAMSISCQLTTGPLAYFYFGTFPRHFLITNLIALPLTGVIIPAILATLILQGLGICPELMVSMTEILIKALLGSLETISGM